VAPEKDVLSGDGVKDGKVLSSGCSLNGIMTDAAKGATVELVVLVVSMAD
jgi:hypothetical protein